jgi:hypothetical protein
MMQSSADVVACGGEVSCGKWRLLDFKNQSKRKN